MSADFQTGYAGLFVGRTVAELMALTLERLGTSSYARYSQTRVLNALNRKHKDFAIKTRCLSAWALIPMRAGVPGYPLPKSCLPDGLERARFYNTSTTYTDLHLRDREWMDEHHPGWKTASPGTPQILVVGDWFGNVLKVESYPPPLVSGTLYTSGTDVGVVVGGTELPLAGGDITGQSTGGSTTTLEDSSVDFTSLGIVSGMAVVKTSGTPGSEPTGFIDVVSEHEITFTDVLSNSGSFAAGDSYQIITGEVGTVTSLANEEEYFFSADVGVISKITVPANNILIEFKKYAVLFDLANIETQKPEIPWAWHDNLADGAAGDILSDDKDRRSATDIKKAAELKASFAGAILECNSKPTKPMKRPARFMPRFKR